MQIKDVITDLIKESMKGPDVTRWIRSGSQILYKGVPIKFMGKSSDGIYRIAYLDKDTGEWIPQVVDHYKYSQLRKSVHKVFKYNFSIDMRSYTHK